MRALVNGKIDVAAVWGPAFGYFAMHAAVPMHIAELRDGDSFSTRKDHFGLQAMQFQIAVGVRRGNDPLRRALNAVISHNRAQIQQILEHFGVPLIDPTSLRGMALAHVQALPAHGGVRRPGA